MLFLKMEAIHHIQTPVERYALWKLSSLPNCSVLNLKQVGIRFDSVCDAGEEERSWKQSYSLAEQRNGSSSAA